MEARRQTRACLLRVRVGVPRAGTWHEDVFVDDATIIVSLSSKRRVRVPSRARFGGSRTVGSETRCSRKKSEARPRKKRFSIPRDAAFSTAALSPASLSDRVEVHVWPGALWHCLSRTLRRRNRRLVQSCRHRQGTSPPSRAIVAKRAPPNAPRPVTCGGRSQRTNPLSHRRPEAASPGKPRSPRARAP